MPEGGKVQYAVKTLKINADGFFETKIGCPPGQALEVKASASMNGNSYTIDENMSKSQHYDRNSGAAQGFRW